QLGEPLFQLDRLRLADDLPMMIEKSYLPVKLFMSLSQEILFLKPLYNLFSENFNQIVRLADEEFYASIVQKEDSELLNI
ncbi:UTRA domain-containing protein, partial [Enterococcus faecalis]